MSMAKRGLNPICRSSLGGFAEKRQLFRLSFFWIMALLSVCSLRLAAISSKLDVCNLKLHHAPSPAKKIMRFTGYFMPTLALQSSLELYRIPTGQVFSRLMASSGTLQGSPHSARPHRCTNPKPHHPYRGYDSRHPSLYKSLLDHSVRRDTCYG